MPPAEKISRGPLTKGVGIIRRPQKRRHKSEPILTLEKKAAEAARKHYAKNAARLHAKSVARAKRNREAINAKRRENYANDLSYRFAQVLRARLSAAFKGKSKKVESAVALLGCTIPELIVHLESQFEPWMTHDNYGKWVVDHHIPVSAYELTCPLQRVLAFHFTNLKPLEKHANHRKYNKLPHALAA